MATLLQTFYETTKIKAADREALMENGITDKDSLQSSRPSLYRKGIASVSDETQGKLRVLLHWLEHNNADEFCLKSFIRHMYLHLDDLESMAKQYKKSLDQHKQSDNAFGLEQQGFNPSTVDMPDDIEEGLDEQPELTLGGPETFEFGGVRYEKGRCYHYRDLSKDRVVVVAIRAFLIKDGQPPRAACVRIVPVSNTFLGQGKNDAFTLYSSRYCQVRQKEPLRLLSELRDEASVEPKTMPKLCYKPQKTGAIRSFAYFFDESGFERVGLRGPPKVVEMFCGSGGMHLGYKENGFVTVKAIDKDEAALETFRHNNPDDASAAECICVNEFLRLYKSGETVEVLHASSPCQGFSKANRNGGKNDAMNNELALSFTGGLRRTKALVGIFENVDGIWSQKGMPYLQRMLAELVEMEYQFRIMVLKACNYGDPQPRPRFIIFASRKFVPLPLPPVPSHVDPRVLLGTTGDVCNRAPWVTTGAVLDMFTMVPSDSFPNMNDRRTSTMTADDEDVVPMKRNELSAAILASGPPIPHYAPDADGNVQHLSVRDVAALQSYPNWYEFFGTLGQKYKQVGNSVPCGLASALARATALVLRFVYREELQKGLSDQESAAEEGSN